jgi:hypothetical protein
MLLTPDRSMRWDGHRLLSAPALAPFAGDADADWTKALEALPWV